MRYTVCLALLAVLGGCSRATPEQTAVNSAAQALGGAERVQAVKTIVIEGEATQGNPGQDMTPEATGQQFTITGYKRSIDVAGGRARVEGTRTPNFEFFQGRQPQPLLQGVDGDVGYNVGANGMATRTSTAVANDRRTEMIYHHPVTAVRAALDAGSTVSNPRSENGQNLVDVRTANGVAFTLATDAAGLPARVISRTDNTNLGDVVIETTFADYQDVNGLRLPARLTTKMDDLTVVDVRVSKQAIDASLGDLAAPAAAISAPAVAGPPPATVAVEEVAPGVWLIAGQSHNSVLVEFADHMTLIETPQNDTRSLAVIAEAKKIRPNKPLTQVVNSHHHFDHSGGLRAAASEGLDIIAHKASAAYLEAALKRPHTIVPDALQKNPRQVKVIPVDGEMTLSDGTMTVNLYAIEGNPHADTFLVAYFPRERLLVQADMYGAGAAIAPYAPNLLQNLEKRNLRIDRIVPLHGKIFPYAELVKAGRPAVAATN
jgi:glyoxylase-like metal-dependent hydrolase (beta-lactamase superfamily II)